MVVKNLTGDLLRDGVEEAYDLLLMFGPPQNSFWRHSWESFKARYPSLEKIETPFEELAEPFLLDDGKWIHCVQGNSLDDAAFEAKLTAALDWAKEKGLSKIITNGSMPVKPPGNPPDHNSGIINERVKFIRDICSRPEYKYLHIALISFTTSFTRNAPHNPHDDGAIRPVQWGEHQNEYTKKIFTHVEDNLAPFLIQMGRPNKGCGLDHISGRYGYVTFDDAMAKNWNVYDYDTDELLGSYDSIDDLINDDWKIST